MSLHTIERIDIKDKLPRNGSLVLCWGHNQEYGIRWIDTLYFEDGKFFGDLEEDYAEQVTHWANLAMLNWNDGVPLHRDHNQ